MAAATFTLGLESFSAAMMVFLLAVLANSRRSAMARMQCSLRDLSWARLFRRLCASGPASWAMVKMAATLLSMAVDLLATILVSRGMNVGSFLRRISCWVYTLIVELGVFMRFTRSLSLSVLRLGNFLYCQSFGVTMETNPLFGLPAYPAPSHEAMYILPDASTSRSDT